MKTPPDHHRKDYAGPRQIPLALDGPLPELLTGEITPETIRSRVEHFQCLKCGKTWQREIMEDEPSPFFRQSQTCGVEGNPGCGAILPGDLEPGDLVSLDHFDKTSPPRSRFGVSVVVDMAPVRNCQSGFMVRIARRDDPTTTIARLDRAWLKKIKTPGKDCELWKD